MRVALLVIATAATAPAGPLARWLAHPGGVDRRWLGRLGHDVAVDVQVLWPLGVGTVGLLGAYVVIAGALRSRWARGGRWVEIAPAAEPDPAGGLALWRMLAPLLTSRPGPFGRRPPVAFEAWATPGGLRLGLWVSPTVSATAAARAVEAAWPGSRARFAAQPVMPAGRPVGGGKAHLVGPDWFPLTVEHTGSDPLRGLLSGLACDAPGEAAVVQVLARPASSRRVARLRRATRSIRRGEPATTISQAFGFFRTKPGGHSANSDPLALADVRDITTKVSGPPHFQVALLYAVTGAAGRGGRRARRTRLRQIAAGLGLYTGRNRLVARRLARPAATIIARRLRRGFLLSVTEVAALAHVPADPAGYGLPAAPARTVAPPPEVAHA